MKKTMDILALSCMILNLNMASASNKPDDPTYCAPSVRAKIIESVHSPIPVWRPCIKAIGTTLIIYLVGWGIDSAARVATRSFTNSFRHSTIGYSLENLDNLDGSLPSLRDEFTSSSLYPMAGYSSANLNDPLSSSTDELTSAQPPVANLWFLSMSQELMDSTAPSADEPSTPDIRKYQRQSTTQRKIEN